MPNQLDDEQRIAGGYRHHPLDEVGTRRVHAAGDQQPANILGAQP
jgi:hypothetical protein